MIKLIHCADMHLDSPISGMDAGKAALRKEELRETFGNIVDLALAENADVLLIAGDLFESENLSDITIRFITRKLASLPAVFIAPGNHDPHPVYKSLELPDNVHIFSGTPEMVRTEKADIYGVGFAESRQDAPLLKSLPPVDADRINILLVHGEITASGVYNPITREQLAASGMNYIALGHTHEFSGLQRVEAAYYAYSGIPEGRGFDECGDKGVISALVSRRTVNASFIPVCKRRHHRIELDITGMGDYEEIIRGLAPLIDQTDIYKITLCGTTSAFEPHLPVLAEKLRDSCFFVKFADKTHPLLPAHEGGLIEMFLRKVEQSAAPAEVRELAVRYGLAALDGREV